MKYSTPECIINMYTTWGFNIKKIERDKAIKLRTKGYSLNEIIRELNVSKSSVSRWVRHIELSENQKAHLKAKGLYKEAIEKRRASRLANENAKRQLIISSAQNSISKLTLRELWLIGVMLYWAEGGKTQYLVRFSNGDPELIKIMMTFFRQVCNVPDNKFRGYIHIHPHLDHIAAEKYWSSVSKIPLTQFYKTYRIPNKSSKNKKDSLPFGTLDIYVMSTEIFLKITGWAKGIFNSYKIY